ncbi:hypothetical protein CFE70_000268 [Pyrenophora teres f. teres 0-1]
MQKEEKDMRDDGDVDNDLGDRYIVTYSVASACSGSDSDAADTDAEMTPATEEKKSEDVVANDTSESAKELKNAKINEIDAHMVENLPGSSDEEVVFKGRVAPLKKKSVREKSQNRSSEKARNLRKHTRRDESPKKNMPNDHAEHEQEPPEPDDQYKSFNYYYPSAPYSGGYQPYLQTGQAYTPGYFSTFHPSYATPYGYPTIPYQGTYAQAEPPLQPETYEHTGTHVGINIDSSNMRNPAAPEAQTASSSRNKYQVRKKTENTSETKAFQNGNGKERLFTHGNGAELPKDAFLPRGGTDRATDEIPVNSEDISRRHFSTSLHQLWPERVSFNDYGSLRVRKATSAKRSKQRNGTYSVELTCDDGPSAAKDDVKFQLQWLTCVSTRPVSVAKHVSLYFGYSDKSKTLSVNIILMDTMSNLGLSYVVTVHPPEMWITCNYQRHSYAFPMSQSEDITKACLIMERSILPKCWAVTVGSGKLFAFPLLILILTIKEYVITCGELDSESMIGSSVLVVQPVEHLPLVTGDWFPDTGSLPDASKAMPLQDLTPAKVRLEPHRRGTTKNIDANAQGKGIHGSSDIQLFGGLRIDDFFLGYDAQDFPDIPTSASEASDNVNNLTIIQDTSGLRKQEFPGFSHEKDAMIENDERDMIDACATALPPSVVSGFSDADPSEDFHDPVLLDTGSLAEVNSDRTKEEVAKQEASVLSMLEILEVPRMTTQYLESFCSCMSYIINMCDLESQGEEVFRENLGYRDAMLKALGIAENLFAIMRDVENSLTKRDEMCYKHAPEETLDELDTRITLLQSRSSKNLSEGPTTRSTNQSIRPEPHVLTAQTCSPFQHSIDDLFAKDAVLRKQQNEIVTAINELLASAKRFVGLTSLDQLAHLQTTYRWFVRTETDLRNEFANKQQLSLLRICLNYLNALVARAQKIYTGIAHESGPDPSYQLPDDLIDCFEGTALFLMQATASVKAIEKEMLRWQYVPGGAVEELNTPAVQHALDKLAQLGQSAQASMTKAEKTIALADPEKNTVSIGPAGPQLLVATILQNLQRRPVLDGVDMEINQLYQEQTSKLQYQVNQFPRKRLLRDIHGLQEELSVVQLVNLWQQKSFEKFLRVLDPRSFAKPTLERSNMFQSESECLNDGLKLLESKAIELKALENRTQYLREQLKQGVEILEEDHGKAILVFTMITTIFLPLSFIASLFGMNTSDIRNTDRGQGFFWSIALPVTAGIVFAAVLLAYHGDKLYDAIVQTYHQQRDKRLIDKGKAAPLEFSRTWRETLTVLSRSW